MIQTLLLACCLVGEPAEMNSAVIENGSARPNVLFLFSDDQRFDTIAALGNSHIETPNLDKLVHRGFTFTHNFCQGSYSGAVCLPSRAMLMSGMSLYRAPSQLDGVTIWPEALRKNGYATFGTGKWHNGSASYARGFTHGGSIFYGGMSNHLKVPIHDFSADGKYPRTKRRLGDRFSSQLFADEAIGFLNDYKRDDPFFMYVSFTAPHDPRMPPKKYLEMYDPEKIPLPKSFMPYHPFNNGEMILRDERLAPWPRTSKTVRRHIAEYYGMITHMDAQIGRILEALNKSGKAENTIIVFAGDHGLAIGRHGLLGKQNLYDHSVRSPLIFAGPGIPHGSSAALVYLFDLFPTCCELTGTEPPKTVEGKSLVSIMQGKKRDVRNVIFGSYKKFQKSIRTDRWKLIRYPHINKTQLFDLNNDPDELKDLSEDAAHAKRVQKLMQELKELQQKFNDKEPLSTETPAPLQVKFPKLSQKKQNRKKIRQK